MVWWFGISGVCGWKIGVWVRSIGNGIWDMGYGSLGWEFEVGVWGENLGSRFLLGMDWV